ncbi:GNAT family N-acetyltransferase [Longibacter salinarum]|uniref:GNAT family N-acetyltransferase n=1 Tax=Longibacter salinarum TaxID=1850348 RepID=A0A2A8CVR4_9BACT|nr:GNAT family N-acetyltransferase [Longibacter salinarum]PEN12805.1 GNAT family N-acetyltransferase [Longibacter salinarum]
MAYADVRRALKTDRDAVTELWINFLDEQAETDDRLDVSEDAEERWKNDFPAWLEDETRRVYVVEADGDVVGFATAHRTAPPPIYESRGEVYLDEIYVQPDYRRAGRGKQLVEAVVAWSDRVHAERIRLSVLDLNRGARDFWEAQDAVAFSQTYTIEREVAEDAKDDEGTKKIGFV